MSEPVDPVVCSVCHTPLLPSTTRPVNFCFYCGVSTSVDKTASTTNSASALTQEKSFQVAILPGQAPRGDQILFSLGSYQILSSIGKGGMGEVFLAYDTVCGRRIALKRIREDLSEQSLLLSRFLKEARVTSQLMHPAIIPIYAIHSDEQLYYTMPYVEGETLKQILRTTRQQEKRGQRLHHLGGSIPALIRIFITVCQAVAYAHAKGVLHRDLKPENVIVGTYGEVMILDWGLAKLLEAAEDPGAESAKEAHRHLTHFGKVVGTIAYMSPERAMGGAANVQTDIYALGVTLYQLLTLHLPFRRESLKEFRANVHKERFLEPSEIAPYREVPPALSAVCRKSLHPSPKLRYQSVEELIHDVEIYIEGRPEWLKFAQLDVECKEDWEFQENVLIAEYVEITRFTDCSDWFNLMISRSCFPQNLRLEAKVTLQKKSGGLGFLLNIPEPPERIHLIDGYCLWIGSEEFPDTKLLSYNVEIMRAPDTYLQTDRSYQIRIEKIENSLHFYLDDQLQLSFISHLPLAGTHIGLLSRDADYTISQFQVSARSQNLTINCLALPDAFLAHKQYETALIEYRRIAYSFPGRAEGREAIFRSGVTLLEQAKQSTSEQQMSLLYEAALEEFAQLHSTPGAPLEYLGKALVYRAQSDYEEELKCFELALRRYQKHPLLHVVEEHISHRMHECSRKHRKATYNFALLVIRHLPDIPSNAQKLFTNLQNHWEALPFFEPPAEETPCADTKSCYFAITLAFWLAKPFALSEILQELLEDPIVDVNAICNTLYALLELGCWKIAANHMQKIRLHMSRENIDSLDRPLTLIEAAIVGHEQSVLEGAKRLLSQDRVFFDRQDIRIAVHLIVTALHLDAAQTALNLVDRLYTFQTTVEDRVQLEIYSIWSELLLGNVSRAGELLHRYTISELSNENSPLYFLYGCYLRATEGEVIAKLHFSGLLDSNYPCSWALIGHFINDKIAESDQWMERAFLWEKRQLFWQLALYYHCAGDKVLYRYYQKLARQYYIFVDSSSL